MFDSEQHNGFSSCLGVIGQKNGLPDCAITGLRDTAIISKLSILYADNGLILFLAETWVADEKRAQPESISYRQAHDSLTCSSKAYMTTSLHIGCCRRPHHLGGGFLSGVVASSQGW